MGYVINLLNFPIIAKKSSFSFVPLPMKLGITYFKEENQNLYISLYFIQSYK
ncbi:MAG: hypothetical protein ACR5K9_08915 [Wolbachia sp.]